MALDKCPHMTACCPHYQIACIDDESKECHHIKRTTASMLAVITSLRQLGINKFSPAMSRYIEEAESFLQDMNYSIE